MKPKRSEFKQPFPQFGGGSVLSSKPNQLTNHASSKKIQVCLDVWFKVLEQSKYASKFAKNETLNNLQTTS